MFSFFKRLTQKPPAKAGTTPAQHEGDVDSVVTTAGVLPQHQAQALPGQLQSQPMLSEQEAKRVLQELPDPLELLELEKKGEVLVRQEHAPYSAAEATDAQPNSMIKQADELDSSFDRIMNGPDELKEFEATLQPQADGELPAPSVVPTTPFYLRLRAGLKRTGDGITSLFTGTQIDDELYEDLEGALLMADAGTAATQYLLDDLKARVKRYKTREPKAVRGLLEQCIADLLKPLEAPLEVGRYTPTVMMVAGVNGAGKTTTIGKLTYHFQSAGMQVILAAGDTFRAAAREQLAVWADRNKVTIISRSEADPASVIFDAVQSGIAKHADVVIADTAGRLPTQMHLMEELKKIQRTISKAQGSAPHEVLLVIDGNTGQNAIAQVRAFDEALGLTGLVVTKLDGTARGGVLCGIARYATTSAKRGKLPVYFIGVGEKLEDLQPFNAAQFAKALVG
jgi:fused signal recognition particle receptor